MAEDQRGIRLAKAENLRTSGTEPYALGFERTHAIADIVERHADLQPSASTGETVSVAGRLFGLRRMGKAAFADLGDQSGRIQIFARAENLGEATDQFSELDYGDWIGVTGEVVTTKKGELSVLADSFVLLTKSLRPWPEKWHGLKDVELRYRQRYVDFAINPEARQIIETRSRTVTAVRDWLNSRGYLEVETPMLQPVAGGALAKPFVTHHDALGIDMYLRIAPELYLKRLVVGGLEKVFEINRNFRNEGVSTSHNPEFTMLELYETFSDYLGMADLLEEMLRAVTIQVTGASSVTWQGNTLDFEKPFRRVQLVELVQQAGLDVKADVAEGAKSLGVEVEEGWSWGKIVAEVYEKKVEPSLIQPTFVMDYPKEVSPLAREHRSDERFTEHLDLVIGGIEIGPAYSELTDPIEQRKRFENQAELRKGGDEEAHEIDEDFLSALEYGMPPTGGLGLGIDRLVTRLVDAKSIREVIAFPALRPEA